MPTPLTSTTYTISATGLRYLPMNWAPRWVNAYYDQTDQLRTLLFSACIYHLDNSRVYFQNYTRSNFYGAEGESRTGYIAKYHFPKDYVPAVTLVCTVPQLVTTTVYEAPTYGSFLYEELHPVFYRDPAGAMYLKNLSMVGCQLTASSGYLDLTSAWAEHPKIQDSLVIVANAWDDRQILDPIDSRIVDNRIKVVTDGLYTVYWQSTRIHTALLAASAYVLVGDEQIALNPHTLQNSWDVGLQSRGLIRFNGESNYDAKVRYQHYAISNSQESLISSVLGQSRALVWNPQDTWSLTGSGCLRVEPLGLEQYQYVTETLIKSGNVYLFTQTPSGVVQIFYKTQPIDSAEYSISGNVLSPISSRLNDAVQGDLQAMYRVVQYNTVSSSGYISALTPGNHRPELRYVLVSRKIQILPAQRKVKEWRWGRQELGTMGLAEFG